MRRKSGLIPEDINVLKAIYQMAESTTLIAVSGKFFSRYALDPDLTKHIPYATYFHLVLMTREKISHFTDEAMSLAAGYAVSKTGFKLGCLIPQ